MGSTINKQLDQYLSNLINQTASYREHLKNYLSTVSFSITISRWFKQQNQVQYILLKGDLGAGKTTFSKHFISNLCSTDINHITSPTFQFLHIYDKKICHFDLYRLSSKSEFIELGFEDYLDHPYCGCIEWPEPVMNLLNKYLLIILSHANNGRSVIVKYVNNEV